jgi:UDP-3-O-[3-hydroxymyristoyl] glucosamine N-acyltransferase
MKFSAKQIAEFIQGTIVGDENATVHTFAKIEEGIPGAISFLSNPKYTSYIYDTQSSIVLVNKDFEPEREIKATLIKVDNAYESLAKLMTLYEQSHPKRTGIDPLAYVAPTAKIGKNVYLAPFACVGDHAEVGDNTELHPHATVGRNAKVGKNCILYTNSNVYHDCIVGDNCILHSGSVIGADGFGFAPTPNGYDKIPQIGIAILEDDVEIGANTCVDRATMGSTIIHKGVKLDNLVQIAHNVTVGENTVIAAEAGIAGSTHVGKNCMFGGQSATTGHLHIGDRVVIASRGAVMTDIEDNTSWMGAPALPTVRARRAHIIYSKLPEIYKTIADLEKKVEELSKK